MSGLEKPSIDHKTIEIFGLSYDLLKSHDSIINHAMTFIKNNNFKVVSKIFHDFSPHGATILFILSTSHLAIHTWPEKGYLHIDVLTCQKMKAHDSIVLELSEIFNVPKTSIKLRSVDYG